MAASSSARTIDVVAAHPTAQVDATRVLDHTRRQSSAVRQLRRALDAIADVGALLLIVWLIPLVILAISVPIVLIMRVVLTLIHKL